jgi:3-deoxy-manno-octulosonate cytidylyltransferase (CMP-KDO synthetase)
MKKVALIPARLDSSRLPQKMLLPLNGVPVIVYTYRSVIKTGLFDEVAVVCDSKEIYDTVIAHGGKAIMSKKEHASGSDRIAEAVEDWQDAELIVNVQGDEPFTKREPLEKLLAVFSNDNVKVASLMQEMHDWNNIEDPNYVKVAVDINMNALFFSRSVIPYWRDRKGPAPVYYEHIGVYAFRRDALLAFTKMPVSPLEAAEKVECLRYLENGIGMKMVVTDYMGIEIDTAEDLARAEQFIKDNGI